MAGALGFGLSALLQAGLGYEKQKHQTKLLQQQNEAELFHDIATKHPEIITQSPEMQKSFKKFYGDDALGLVMGVGQATQHAQQQAGGLFSRGAPAGGAAPNPMQTAPTLPTPTGESGMSVVGGPAPLAAPTGLPGGMTPEKFQTLPPDQQAAYVEQASRGGGFQAPAGGAPPPFEGAHSSVAAVWDDAGQMRDMLDKADAFMSSPEYQYLDEGHRKAIDKRYELFSKRLAELEKEDREFSPGRAKAKGEFESTVEAATRPGAVSRKSAEETAGASARIGVETSPAAVSGAAKKAAAVKGAEVTAESTPKALKAKEEAAAATARGRISVGEKWTPKDALDARSKALTQAKAELTKPGKLFGTVPPSPKMLKQRAAAILLNEGLNPDTGMKLKAGEKVTDPTTGKTLTWVP